MHRRDLLRFGANPQLSVYAISAKLTEALVARLAHRA